jgi:hypothetical protein
MLNERDTDKLYWLCAKCVINRKSLPNVSQAKYYIMKASPARR